MIILETVHKTKNSIFGQFKLNDKTTTKFCIKRGESWEQWGNTTENLSKTVKRVEELEQELYI